MQITGDVHRAIFESVDFFEGDFPSVETSHHMSPTGGAHVYGQICLFSHDESLSFDLPKCPIVVRSLAPAEHVVVFGFSGQATPPGWHLGNGPSRFSYLDRGDFGGVD